MAITNPIYISNVYISGFKRFREFRLELSEGINIIVGDNETGKSTLLEAVHLALTGHYHGKLLRNNLTEYIFHKPIVDEFLDGSSKEFPRVMIELFFSTDDYAEYEGDGNIAKRREKGIRFGVEFNEELRDHYDSIFGVETPGSLPIEYYHITCKSFARELKLPRNLPMHSALVDSASARQNNGLDLYVSQIVRDQIEDADLFELSSAYRRMKESFANDVVVTKVSSKLKSSPSLSTKNISLNIDHASHRSWDSLLTTYVDEVPFHNAGKGEQCHVKTNLALAHKKSQSANVLLLEEPENHLSHARLHRLLSDLKTSIGNKQAIVSTHSSFVANKLNLSHLTLLANDRICKLGDLAPGTWKFFSKLAGYDTLRLLLCKHAVLVEGPSDELVVQRAYRDMAGSEPIVDGVDVLSVGTAFIRFLEIASTLGLHVTVITDTDGSLESVKDKYKVYLNEINHPSIKIHFAKKSPPRPLGLDDSFNIDTLEPHMWAANGRNKLNEIFDKSYSTDAELLKYMRGNKTDCALMMFETDRELQYPEYIVSALDRFKKK